MGTRLRGVPKLWLLVTQGTGQVTRGMWTILMEMVVASLLYIILTRGGVRTREES